MHLLLDSLLLKEQSPRDLGSPGNRQLLQLQLFSPKILNFGPPLYDLVLLSFESFGSVNLFGHPLMLNDF